jgi:glycerate kinase
VLDVLIELDERSRIEQLLDAGIERMLIGLGGSASTDAGLPILAALGDRQPPPGGAVLLTDVRSPLLGPDGSAAVFAPQKGANAEAVVELERRLEGAVALLGGDPTEPGSGAAGGVGFGLRHWGATIQPGSEFIANLTGLPAAIAQTDSVLTGEGRFDSQSLSGKIVGYILQEAERFGTPAGVVAGSFLMAPDCWHCSLVDLAGSAAEAQTNVAHWLENAGALAARNVVR